VVTRTIPNGNDLKKHAASTRLEYSNERHGRERNGRMMRMASPVNDGWRIIDGMCTVGPFTYLSHRFSPRYRESEAYVARTFDPEYMRVIVETGMGTPGTRDLCCLDSSVTVLVCVTTRWAVFIRRSYVCHGAMSKICVDVVEDDEDER